MSEGLHKLDPPTPNSKVLQLTIISIGLAFLLVIISAIQTWVPILTLTSLIGLMPAVAHSIGGQHPESTLCAANNFGVVNNRSDVWTWQTYQSSNITPPYLSINRTEAELADGFLFISQGEISSTGVKQASPFILTDDNELIWGGPEGYSSDFRQQYWGDQSVLTFWLDTGKATTSASVGRGWGEIQIYDDTYQHIKTVCLQLNLTLPEGSTADCEADLHESFITKDKTIMLTAYNVTQADLTSLGGSKDGWAYDLIAVEVDLETNEPVFIWSPLAHLPVNSTHEQFTGSSYADPFDWFHINSVQKWGELYLINSRTLWRTFLVNRQGEILWYIDGENGGSFGSLPPNGTFSWAHMARIRNISSTEVLLSYFANDSDGPSGVANPSKGLTLHLTLPPSPEHPPKLVTDFYDHQNSVISVAEGSFTPLDNGNTLMGYGYQPFIKEYGPEGDLRWSAQFANSGLGQSYRAYKLEWHATPYTKPSLVVTNVGEKDNLSKCAGKSSYLRGYVSWNGATDVEKYQVYVGNNKEKLRSIGEIDKKGFETKFYLPSGVSLVQVAACQSGKIVRKSDIVRI